MSRPGVTDRGVETRRRLVEAATRAFMERGYAATSLSDLMAAADLTKGGFYFHFPSKAELALEVVRSCNEQLRAEVLAAASEFERATDQLVAMVHALVRAMAAKSHSSGMAGVERLCAELRADGVDDPAVVKPHDEWIATTADLFRRAQAEGDMDADLDPVVSARFAVASFVGLEDLARGGGSPDVLGMNADEYLRVLGRAFGLRLSTITWQA